MTGPWKAWKSRSSFSTLSTVPWKSRQHREIPTFPQPGFAPDGKVENQRQVSHFPTGGSRHRFLFALYSNLKLKKASRPLRGLPSLVFQDHLVLETEHDFRIILGLENARLIHRNKVRSRYSQAVVSILARPERARYGRRALSFTLAKARLKPNGTL
jgi:hypothetical protein